jgi:hypothetical protein
METEFWILDVLVRIRIPDSYNWITDSDPDPALFFSGFHDCKQKICFFPSFFAVWYIMSRYINISNKSLRSHKIIEIMIFLIFFFLMEGSVRRNNY